MSVQLKGNEYEMRGKVAHQGLHQGRMQLTQSGGHKGAKGVAHNTGLLEALLLHDCSHSMGSVIHLAGTQAQTHGHMAELQHDHGVGAGGGKQHPHEVDVRRLQLAPWRRS